jgi:hypothetical protein
LEPIRAYPNCPNVDTPPPTRPPIPKVPVQPVEYSNSGLPFVVLDLFTTMPLVLSVK